MFYKKVKKTKRSVIKFDREERLTHQSFKQQCDINYIVDRAIRTGVVSHVNRSEPRYEDVPSVDYHTMLNMVNQAKESFMSLPSKIRSFFDNDPGRFLEFVHNPENEEKMIEMGLAKKRPGTEVGDSPTSFPGKDGKEVKTEEEVSNEK